MENWEEKVKPSCRVASPHEAMEIKEAIAPTGVAGRSGIALFTWGPQTNAISHGAGPPWQDFFQLFFRPFLPGAPAYRAGVTQWKICRHNRGADSSLIEKMRQNLFVRRGFAALPLHFLFKTAEGQKLIRSRLRGRSRGEPRGRVI